MKKSNDFTKGGGHNIDLLPGVVNTERGARSAGNAEPIHERLGAMMPGSYGNTILIQKSADIVGMHII